MLLKKFELWSRQRGSFAVVKHGGLLVEEHLDTEPGASCWVNYNELTTSSLEIIVSKGNHPQMALIHVSELL